jgi:hypothetical protein
MKAPILSRELLFDTLRDGSKRLLDWNLVNTELGAMLEPRNVLPAMAPMTAIDAYDASFTRFVEFDEDLLVATFNVSGRQLPMDFTV